MPKLLDVFCGSHYVGTSRCVVFSKIHFTSGEEVTEILKWFTRINVCENRHFGQCNRKTHSPESNCIYAMHWQILGEVPSAHPPYEVRAPSYGKS